MRTLLLLFACIMILSCSKKNKDAEGGGCGESPYIAPQPYSFPSWHPNGEIFSFNHVPIAGIEQSPCRGPIYKLKNDSAGFYTMNKDRSGFTRVMDYFSREGIWSPDGSKLMYIGSKGVYIIPFDGSSLDTAAKQLVPIEAMTGMPIFNAGSDSIYFRTITAGTASMLNVIAIDGTGKKEIRSAEYIDLSFASNKRFYYLSVNREIWSMDQNGADLIREVTSPAATYEQRRKPQFYNGNIYYLSSNRLMRTGNNAPMVEDYVYDYAISSKGEIIYNQYEYRVSEDNKQNGVFWIMNADGSNKRQLTFNNF